MARAGISKQAWDIVGEIQGGTRKRCTAGKNCSATCISREYVCEVELGGVYHESLKNLRQLIDQKQLGTSLFLGLGENGSLIRVQNPRLPGWSEIIDTHNNKGNPIVQKQVPLEEAKRVYMGMSASDRAFVRKMGGGIAGAEDAKFYDPATDKYTKVPTESRGIAVVRKYMEQGGIDWYSHQKMLGLGAVTIDHFLPSEKGGGDNPSNWVFTSKPLNAWKGAKNEAEFYNSIAKASTVGEDRWNSKARAGEQGTLENLKFKKLAIETNPSEYPKLWNSFPIGARKYLARELGYTTLLIGRGTKEKARAGSTGAPNWFSHSLSLSSFKDKPLADSVYKSVGQLSRDFYEGKISAKDYSQEVFRQMNKLPVKYGFNKPEQLERRFYLALQKRVGDGEKPVGVVSRPVSTEVTKKSITPKATPKADPKPNVKPAVKPPDLEKQIAGVKQLVAGFRSQGFKNPRIIDELRKLGVRPALISEVLTP